MRLTILLVTLSITISNAQSTIKYYDRYGMEKGKAEISSNESPYKPYQPSQYVSSVPLDLIAKVGAQKQQAYDQRLLWIQGKLDNIAALGNKLLRKYPDEYNYYYKQIVAFVDKMNTGRYDLSNTSVFSPLASELNGIEQSIQATYEDIVANGGRSIMQPRKSAPPFEVYKSLYSSSAGSPQTYLGKTTLEVKRLIQHNRNYREGLTDYGRVYLDYEVDENVSVTYYFDSLSVCNRVIIYTPVSHKESVVNELAQLYTRADVKTWIDKKQSMKWTVDEEQEQDYHCLAIRIRKL